MQVSEPNKQFFYTNCFVSMGAAMTDTLVTSTVCDYSFEFRALFSHLYIYTISLVSRRLTIDIVTQR